MKKNFFIVATVLCFVLMSCRLRIAENSILAQNGKTFHLCVATATITSGTDSSSRILTRQSSWQPTNSLAISSASGEIYTLTGEANGNDSASNVKIYCHSQNFEAQPSN
jgi:hypothetical protein